MCENVEFRFFDLMWVFGRIKFGVWIVFAYKIWFFLNLNAWLYYLLKQNITNVYIWKIGDEDVLWKIKIFHIHASKKHNVSAIL